MGYGLQGAYGLDAAQQGLRQRLMDQMLLQKQKQDMEIQLREQTLREQEAQQRAEEFKLSQDERRRAAGERGAVAHAGLAEKGLNQIGMGGDVTDQQFNQTFKGTPSESVVPPLMTLPGRALSPVSGETGTTPIPQMEQGIHRSIGTAPQQADASKKQFLGRLISGLPAGSKERMALEFQQATGDNPPAGVFDKTGKGQLVQNAKGEYVRVGDDNTVTPVGISGFHQAPQPIVIQTETGPQRVDRGSGTASPIKDAGGKVIGPKLSGAERTRMDSATAVLQTGDDIVANLQKPDFAAKLGPELGRYNSLRDFIGNPPPEFSELAGQIESYALANMGVHGMRSVAGSEKIKALLDGHHTPESMIGAIKGLNGFASHFVENKGGKPKDTGTKPSAADLIKKYSK